jgi:hypothetical protein
MSLSEPSVEEARRYCASVQDLPDAYAEPSQMYHNRHDAYFAVCRYCDSHGKNFHATGSSVESSILASCRGKNDMQEACTFEAKIYRQRDGMWRLRNFQPHSCSGDRPIDGNNRRRRDHAWTENAYSHILEKFVHPHLLRLEVKLPPPSYFKQMLRLYGINGPSKRQIGSVVRQIQNSISSAKYDLSAGYDKLFQLIGMLLQSGHYGRIVFDPAEESSNPADLLNNDWPSSRFRDTFASLPASALPPLSPEQSSLDRVFGMFLSMASILAIESCC